MLEKTLQGPTSLTFLRIGIPLTFLYCFNPFILRAQCISNNEIRVAATCTGNGLAVLYGSAPKGGTGTYTYAWEKNTTGNCGEGGFVAIAGATGQDYVIPTGRDAAACYRRIVSSGNCKEESNKLNVKTGEIPSAGSTPAAPQALVQHQSCSQATGSIIVTPVHGMQYSINGTDYQVSNIFNDVAPGTYKVTLKNSGGCVSNTTSVTVNASGTRPQAPQASAQSPQNCSQATGSITVTAVQGMQYSINGTQYQPSNVFNNLQPGNYSVTVKNSAGCVSAATAVTVGAAPSAPQAPQASVQSPQNCSQATGSITVTAVQGMQYSINGTQYQPSNVFNNLQPGNYSVTVKNSAGCVSHATAVTVGAAPSAPQAPQASAQSPQNCSQATGSITVTAVQGMQYSINGTQYQPSNVFNNLQPGNYSVTVKNSAGCVSAATAVTIGAAPSAPSAPQASVQSPQNCSQAIGSITVTAVQGMQYSINGTQYQPSNVFNNLQPGNYSVTVKNSAGCVSAATAVTVGAAPSAPQAPQASVQSPQNCSQATGSITVTAVQGMQYSINGTQYQPSNVFNNLQPGNYSVTIKNTAGCVSPATAVTIGAAPSAPSAPQASAQSPQNCSQATGSITVTVVQGMQYSINGTQYQPSNVFNNLQPGNYGVTIKNSAGCVSAATAVTIGAAPSAPQAPQASAQSPQNCSQATGSITVTAVQGMQYSINGTQYQPSNVFNNLQPGNYGVTIKNSAGCVSAATAVTVGAAPSAPQAPQASVQSPQNCSQATGSITVTAVQGMQYSINGTQYQPSNVFNNLQPGNYSVTVKNSAGCVSHATAVTVGAAPSAPSGTISPGTASICEGKSQVLTATGGTSYQWKLNGADIPGANVSSYTAKAEGTYSVTIINGNCKGLASNNAIIKVLACIPVPGVETQVFVPAAFTPDNNSINDYLLPQFRNVSQLKYFKIFNRWGQLVFQTNVIGEGWNGNLKGVPQPSETYSWMLECLDNNAKVIKQSGTSILIR